MKIKQPSNKNFGTVFFAFFLILSLYPFFFTSGLVNKNLLLISIIFLTLGLMNSKLLTPLNKLWMKFGMLLSKITSPLIMLIIYIFVLTPTGLLKRLFTKNYFDIKYDKELKSYWIMKENNLNSMDNQF